LNNITYTQIMNRRKFIALSGTSTLVPLAGCSTDETGNGNGEDPEQDTFPDGLSENGVVDIEQIIGEENGLLSLSSVTVEIEAEFPDTTEITTIQTSKEEETSYIVSELDGQENSQTQEQYESDGVIYSRAEYQNPQSGEDNVDYRSSESEYDAESMYAVGFVRDAVENVEFAGPDSTEGPIVYSAEMESIGAENPIRSSFESIDSMSIETRFTTDGLVDSVTVDVESSEGNITQTITYSNFNETTVEEPDWLQEAIETVEEREANRPAGSVSFDQKENGDVTITIDSLENTETVTVSPTQTTLEEGGTITITQEQYMSEGEPGRIVVFTQYDRNVVTIDSYTPTTE
jgi:hypothetical protein